MNWEEVAERFDRNDASRDAELNSYLVNRAEAARIAKLPRVTILGPRGSGKSALLRSMEFAYGNEYVVARVTYKDLERLSLAIAEAPGVKSAVDDIKQGAINFWAIATLASLLEGRLVWGKEKDVREGGVELGLQGRDFIESLSEKVEDNLPGVLSLLGTAFGVNLPKVAPGGRPSKTLKPFSLLRKLIPHLKKVLAERSVAFQVDEIDGVQADLNKIAGTTVRYAQSLHSLCTGSPRVKYALAVNPIVWARVKTSGANPKSFGRRHVVNHWTSQQLWQLWRLRLDPAMEMSERDVRNSVPLASRLEVEENERVVDISKPNVFGCRPRPRTFIDLWCLIFEDAAFYEQAKISEISKDVWNRHLSSSGDDIVTELAFGIGGIEELLEVLRKKKIDSLTEEGLEDVIDDALGRISGTVAEWLRQTPRKLLGAMEEAGLVIKESGEARATRWRLQGGLIAFD